MSEIPEIAPPSFDTGDEPPHAPASHMSPQAKAVAARMEADLAVAAKDAEITRLRALVEEAREALEPFVPPHQYWMDEYANDALTPLSRVTWGDIRRARATLTKAKAKAKAKEQS